MEDSDAHSKVIINGQEYDATEAGDYLEIGRRTKELEQKYNTTLDNVWPEFGKSRQELKTLNEELATAKAQLTEYSEKKASQTETPTDVAEAQQAARKLGLILNEDLDKAGYIKKDDLDSYFQSKEQEKQAINAVLGQADDLVKEIDGSDGRPKFNKKAVMAYASAYGFNDLKAAYEDMNGETLQPWKDAQIAAQKARSLKTLSGNAGSKEPGKRKVNNDNLRDVLSESLWGSQE